MRKAVCLCLSGYVLISSLRTKLISFDLILLDISDGETKCFEKEHSR